MPESGAVTVAEVVQALGATVLGGADLTRAVTGAQVCDLLSHVMAKGQKGQIWITIQTHPNIVAVAALAGLAAIVLAHDVRPEEDTIVRAEEEGMPLLLAAASAYTLAGRLYELGVR